MKAKRALTPAAKAPESVIASAAPPMVMPNALRQYLEQLEVGNLLADADEARAWDIVIRGLEMSAAGHIIAGHQLKRLRAELPAGKFAAELAERQIARRTAYEAIQVYDAFASMPEISCVRTCAQLGFKKTLALCDLTPDEFTALANGDEVRGLTYEQATEMSVRDLDTHLKEWKRQHDDEVAGLRSQLAADAERLRAVTLENRVLRNRLEGRPDPSATPPWATTMRMEAAVLTEHLRISLHELREHTREILIEKAGVALPEDPQGSRRAALAANVFCQLQAVMAETQALLQPLLEHYPEAAAGLPGPLAWMEPEEVEQFTAARQMLLQEHQSQAKSREAQRANAQPGRRGRPRKV